MRSNYDFYQCTYIILRVCRSTDRIIFLQVAHKSPFSVRYWGLGVIPFDVRLLLFSKGHRVSLRHQSYGVSVLWFLSTFTGTNYHTIPSSHKAQTVSFFFILAFKCIYYSISRPEEISTIYRRLLPSDPLVLLHKHCGILWLWIYKPLIHPGS